MGNWICFELRKRIIIEMKSIHFGCLSFLHLYLEAVGPQYRSNVGMAIQFGWAFGYIVLPGVAYVLRDFRLIQLACTIPEFVLLLWWFALPESPRWQLTHGKFKEAERAMRNAAEINQRPTELLESKLKKLLEKAEAVRYIFGFDHSSKRTF